MTNYRRKYAEKTKRGQTFYLTNKKIEHSGQN